MINQQSHFLKLFVQFALFLFCVAALLAKAGRDPEALVVPDNLLSQANYERDDDEKKVTKLGNIEDDSILECSGIAISRGFERHFWVHNDSGAAASLFLIDYEGKAKSEVSLKGVKNIDFEDIVSFSYDSKHYVAVADCGDNARRRKQYLIHIIEEPELDSLQPNETLTPLSTLTYRYHDGQSRDCESIAYFPSTKQFLVCSKPRAKEVLEGKYAELFKIDFDLGRKTQQSKAIKVGRIAGGLITGMDCSADGKRLVLRNYLYANLWSFEEASFEGLKASKAVRISMPLQRQAEAICFSKDGKSVYTTSEGKNPALYEVKLE